jgi:TonB-dependent starch-binding outer membrane protein SusC
MNYQLKNGRFPQQNFLKWIRPCKTVFVIILCFVMQSNNKVFSQNSISIDMKNVSVEQVLNQIESKTIYRFLYNKELVDVTRKVSITVKDQTINVILDQVFKNSDITYSINGKQIVLTKVEVKKPVIIKKKVSGTVTDLNGSAIIGATVLQKGTTNGTITDINGNYSLTEIPENAFLQFSYIGMKVQEVGVGNKTNINVLLEEDVVSLNEVVAIGYGVVKKKLVTGATINVSGDDIQKMNTVSPLAAMQSQSPGVSITKNSGKPGDGFKVNIRGLGTIGNASPLVIIDNVVGGDLNMLNPGDIESIDVLKDAASAAIYGARAANGVILIKTKQGKKGKPSLSYDGYYGVQNVAKYVDVLNAQQYIELQNESYQNIGSAIPNWAVLVPDYTKIQDGWTGTNWQKEFSNPDAPIQNHSVNLTGGSEFSTFSMGMSYTSQEGIYGQPKAPRYDRYSFRLNSEYVILKNKNFDIIKFGENILYNYIKQDQNGLATGNIYSNDMRNMIGTHPLMGVYDDNNEFTRAIPWCEAVNPIGLYTHTRSYTESNSHSLRINPYIEIQPVKDLIYRSSFGYKLNAFQGRGYIPVFDLGGRSNAVLDQVNQSMSTGYGFQFENTITYKTLLNDTHNINAMIGQSIEMNGFGTSVSGSNKGSIFNSFEYAYLNNVKTLNASNLALNGSPWGRSSIASFFGRVNYDFNEKYMASLIMRADGSSNFAKGKQWGYFPSVAAGWLLSEELFMEPARNVMDYFKLRASWGQNGNQDIAPFQYLSSYSFSYGDYYFGTDKKIPSTGGFPRILPNPDVTWETSEQINIGFDSRLFDSRLVMNFDWYNKTTRDWLVQAPVPATWGAAAPFVNGGDVENKGVEFILNWKEKIGDLTYSIGGNIAFNQNKVTRIANTEGIIEGATTIFSTADRTSFYRAQVGYPIGYFYGYKTAGVFQSQADIDAYTDAKLATVKPGDLKYVDTDKNGIIDSKDKTMIGDPNPDAIYGFNVSLGYKGFDLSASANGVMGNQIASNLKPAERTYSNWPAQYLGRWHGEGTSNRYPRIDANTNNWGWNSDIYVDNGDFLRIQNVTLGYDFKKLIPKMILTQARIYISANNLLTLTQYYGADPEIGYAAEGWSKGIDLGFYPSPRTLMVGANLKF